MFNKKIVPKDLSAEGWGLDSLVKVGMYPPKETIQEREGVIIAYRAWQVLENTMDLRPASYSNQSVWWKPGERYEARCNSTTKEALPHPCPGSPYRDGDEMHETQALYCECGIHAYANINAIVNDYKPYYYLYGRVALWGDTWIHDNGYRAQYAYPQLFYIDKAKNNAEQIKNLADAWGIEVAYLPEELQKISFSEKEVFDTIRFQEIWNQEIENSKKYSTDDLLALAHLHEAEIRQAWLSSVSAESSGGYSYMREKSLEQKAEDIRRIYGTNR